MNLLLLSLIILTSFIGLGSLFLRLQKDLNGCVGTIASRDSDKFQKDRTCEFYNAFADRQPKGARTVLPREAA
ncbi:MAG: hypothetical protein JWM88_762 [Verrucomicrobia bacterium]|nr:hypothetical protein [Verrucomicrobiota bacterium]